MVLKLEVFETNQTERAQKTVVIDSMQLEETKLASYDAGYTAGWEDAAAAHSTDQSKVKADLARNLQTLSFTYHEARNHILKSLRPLLMEISAKLMPEVARHTLAPMILETLLPIAESLVETPVELRLNPLARKSVETLLEGSTSLPLQISEERSLSEGQVYLKLGTQEAKVDLDRAIGEIAEAISAFFDAPQKEILNG